MIEWKYPINAQAKAVRCYLEGYDGLDVSWVEYNGHGSFSAELSIAEWDNGRERGYIVSCRQSGVPRQMNIAFFEHRNTDSINAISFETKPRWQRFNSSGLQVRGPDVDRVHRTFSLFS